jgi:hypothetical protein
MGHENQLSIINHNHRFDRRIILDPGLTYISTSRLVSAHPYEVTAPVQDHTAEIGAMSLNLLWPIVPTLVTAVAVAGCSSPFTRSSATPEPGSVGRNNISLCLDTYRMESCAAPESLGQAKQQMIDIWVRLANIQRDHPELLSSRSFGAITDMLNTDMSAITEDENGRGSITIHPYMSLYSEADGGEELANERHNLLTGINTKPYLSIVVPQLHSIPDDANTDGVIVHEWGHAARAIIRWQTTGSFDESPDHDFDGSKYHSQTVSLEEYEMEWYGDVAEIAIAQQNGDLDNPAYRKVVDERLNLYGGDIAYEAWWLDQHGVTPDNPLWQILYDSQDYSFNSMMVKKYGSQSYAVKAQAVRDTWDAYPWTLREENQVTQMIADGMASGFITSPKTFPPLPPVAP